MSMWLALAKVSPDTLESARTRPEILRAIFFGGSRPAGMGDDDMYGTEYDIVDEIARQIAAEDHGSDDWKSSYPWLRRAIGDRLADGAEHLEFRFTYGRAFALPAAVVAQVAVGLAEEGWLSTAEANDPNSTAQQKYGYMLGVAPFYAAADRAGMAIVGGVS
jgi:hypothetical protein